MYPTKFENLIAEFNKLPGIGAKSAERMAFSVLNWDPEKQNDLIQALQGLQELKICKVCGSLSDTDICSICSDPNRDHSQICVVQMPRDVYSIEAIQEYNGLYHVLNGLINIQKGVLPENLNIGRLEKRITPDVKEIILALDPTVEGETTALYLTRLLENQTSITRLASGIPVGGKLDYIDSRTLAKAFHHRQKS